MYFLKWGYFMCAFKGGRVCGWNDDNQYQLCAKIGSQNAPVNINFKPMSVHFADPPLLHPSPCPVSALPIKQAK